MSNTTAITLAADSVELDNGENLRDLNPGDSVDLRSDTGHPGLWITSAVHGEFRDRITLHPARTVTTCTGTATINTCRLSGTPHTHPVDAAGNLQPRPDDHPPRTRTPERLQRERTKGWRKREGSRYVGRGTPWGNPYAVNHLRDGRYAVPDPFDTLVKPATFTDEDAARAHAVRRYRSWLDTRPDLIARARRELAGRDLMCYCPLPEPGQPDHCHAQIVLQAANSREPT